MTDDAQKRFRRLLDELEDIGDEHGRVSFGILSTSPATRFSDELWGRVGSLVFRHPYRIIPVVGRSFWVEPLADRDACICYWFREEGVESFKGWCKKAAAVLTRRRETLGGHFEGGEHRELLRTLCALAVQDDVLSQLVKKRLVDVNDPDDAVGVLFSLPRGQSTLTYEVWEVEDASKAVAEILASLLAITPRSPGFRFAEDTRVWTINGALEDGTKFHILWDTTTHVVTCEGGREWKSDVLKPEEETFLESILRAKGEWRTSKAIFGTAAIYGKLNVTRLRDDLPGPLPELIKGKPGKGNRLRTELLK